MDVRNTYGDVWRHLQTGEVTTKSRSSKAIQVKLSDEYTLKNVSAGAWLHNMAAKPLIFLLTRSQQYIMYVCISSI